MRKLDCLKKWIDYNGFSGHQQSIIVNMWKSDAVVIAETLIYPFSKRFEYIKFQFESGKYNLGYRTCVENTIREISNLILDLQYALEIFYKKDWNKTVRKISLILNDTKTLYKYAAEEYEKYNT